MRTGAPWRDLPEQFGSWNSIFRQFRRRADGGVLDSDVILEALAGSGAGDVALQMVDTTIVRAHHCAGDEKAQRARPFARRLLDQDQRAHQRSRIADRARHHTGTKPRRHRVPGAEAGSGLRSAALAGRQRLRLRCSVSGPCRSGRPSHDPDQANRKVKFSVDKAIYSLRNRIERFFNRLKNSRRAATRYDKLHESFAAFVILDQVCPHSLA